MDLASTAETQNALQALYPVKIGQILTQKDKFVIGQLYDMQHNIGL